MSESVCSDGCTKQMLLWLDIMAIALLLYAFRNRRIAGDGNRMHEGSSFSQMIQEKGRIM